MIIDTTINLRVLLKDRSSHDFVKVTEYVQGKRFFYILIDEYEVHVIPTKEIKEVFRFNARTNHEWPIKLKKWTHGFPNL